MEARPNKCWSVAMKYFDARSSTNTDEKAGYHRFYPDLTIAGQPLQYFDDGDFRYLGRPTNVHGSEELARSTITSKLDEWLQLVDNQILPNTSKLWLYQHFIIPKLSWCLTALDLTLTFVKRLQAKATKYLKKWSGLPRSANTAILFLGKSGRAGLAYNQYCYILEANATGPPGHSQALCRCALLSFTRQSAAATEYLVKEVPGRR